jgi:predicted Ser/Thr protein kinase
MTTAKENLMNVPTIRIEIERMRQTMSTMLTEQAALVDAELQAALDKFCQPDNIKRVVQEAAHSALEAAVKGEISSFFSYGGAGRKSVAAAVQDGLAKMGLLEKDITDEDLWRALSWAQDLGSLKPDALADEDYELARRLCRRLGMPEPFWVTERQP